MFVSRKAVFRKSFSELSCVYLSLEKLVNGKHFLVNGKYIPVNGKHFLVNFSQRKIWLGFQESVFLLAVFVFQKMVSRKSLSKLSCVYLSLEKLVNGKHFLVNGKYFPVNGKHFSVKKKFGLVFRKVFFLCCVCFPESGFREITFQIFLCLFAIRKVGKRKTLSSKRKI